MITIDVAGLEKLAELIQNMSGNRFGARIGNISIPDILALIQDELYEFAKLLYLDPSVPREYSSSITCVFDKEANSVYLVAWGAERWKKKAELGDAMAWRIYKCPKRGYFGGELSKEYTGPEYLVEKWREYRPIFINNIKMRLVQFLRGDV